MGKQEFIHLHVHSEYSILDGACRIDRLLDMANDYEMSSLAVTDHGNMFGAIDFYSQAKNKGIKPIIGCEFYIAPKSMEDKKLHETKVKYYHLVLIATNNIGYQNLLKLVTYSYFDGFYYKPRIDKELLSKYSDGLIALSACLHGEIPFLIIQEQLDKARQVANFYKEMFGAENFFLELMDHGMEEQKIVNKELIKIGSEIDIPLVATNDCHYLNAKDAESHDVLLCIQTGKKLSDKNRMKFSSDQFYFKSPDEMKELFKEVPEAIKNTVVIAERCNVELEFGKLMLPNYAPPDGSALDDYFELMSKKGLERRFEELGIQENENKKQKYWQRLDYEISVIRKMKFPGYFLIVWDFIKYAKENKIPVGPGRGSAAGSLVSYSLRITDIDPLQYNLVFERFLNPSRVSMPDIDIDLCMRSRSRVIDYVSNKYGKENVSQLITFGTMAAKAVIRDVGRVLDIPLADVDRIAKMIPKDIKITLKKALDKEPLLRKEIKEKKEFEKLFEISMVLEGLKRHPSTHAAGVIISKEPLINYTPFYKSTNNERTTQYSQEFLEKLGLLKMDFLGLMTLTIIDDTVKMIDENHDILIDFDKIPLDDKETFDLISKGETIAVFQFESHGMREYLKLLRPTSIEDLTAMNALYRPGPMDNIPEFIKRKQKPSLIRYLVPIMEPILKNTYGIIVYQEQVMQLVQALGNFSLGDADILRRAMGKKKTEIMAKMKPKFFEGTKKNNIDNKTATAVFELIEKFAKYGFNKSHSVAYSYVAYQTAWLKTHYTAEFFAANMTARMNNQTELTTLINEAYKFGIRVLLPDINISQRNFTFSENAIRLGLGIVKNVGLTAVDSIIENRKLNGPYKSLLDFCRRTNLRIVNKRVFESLIKAGALDSFGVKRSQMLNVIEIALEMAQKYQRDQQAGQLSLFDVELDLPMPDIQEFSHSQILAMEKKLLGFYFSGLPLDSFKVEMNFFSTHDIITVKSLGDNHKFSLCGIIESIKKHLTKKKERMAFFSIKDNEDSLEVTILPDVYQKVQAFLKTDYPVLLKGEMNLINGSTKAKALDIIPLSKIRQKNLKRLIINFELNKTDISTLINMKKIFLKFKGNCPVILNYHITDNSKINLVEISIDKGFKILPSEDCITELENLLGDNILVFDYSFN